LALIREADRLACVGVYTSRVKLLLLIQTTKPGSRNLAAQLLRGFVACNKEKNIRLRGIGSVVVFAPQTILVLAKQMMVLHT